MGMSGGGCPSPPHHHHAVVFISTCITKVMGRDASGVTIWKVRTVKPNTTDLVEKDND